MSRRPEPRLPSPEGNWKMVTKEQLEAYLEKQMAPHIALKISVEVAEELICLMEAQVMRKGKTAGQMLSPHNAAQLMNEAELLRAMAEKLKRACTEWHAKNGLGGP